MTYYETVFLVRQELNATQVEELTKQFCDILTSDNGTIHKTEQWGLRSLAYKIHKAKKAHYVLIESESTGPAIHEMERQMRLHDDVMRYMTIKNNALSTEASVPIRGSNQDKEAA